MQKRRQVIIVGGLPACWDEGTADKERQYVLDELKKLHPEVTWKWYITWCSRLDLSENKRSLDDLRMDTADPMTEIVKLHRLNKDVVTNPVLPKERTSKAPKDIDDGKALIEWLGNWVGSQPSNIQGAQEWRGNLVELALCAILCKLVGAKNWMKDEQGHGGTMEAHLLKGLPVKKPKPGNLVSTARALLGDLQSLGLLGLKDGHKERKWHIREHVPAVKQCLLNGNFDPLVEALPEIATRINRKGDDRPHALIVPRPVLTVCQEQDRSQEKQQCGRRSKRRR